MIYAYDDPELGYVDEDYGDVLDCSPEWCGRRSCTGLIHDGRHVIPASCSVCEGDIPEDATLPLCDPCRGTAKATAEAFPGGPERFRHTRRETR